MKTIKYNFLISIFLVLLIILNALGLWIRMDVYPEELFGSNTWEYLNSDMFKMITGTLMFPIILILLENKFKIIQAARDKRIKEVEAIKQSEINKRREILDSINADWDVLYEQVNELKYFVVDPNNHSNNIIRLAEIQKALTNSISNWDRNINALYYHYPRLKKLEPVYLYFVNMYVTLSTSMAWHIRGNLDKPERIGNLQEAYEVITGNAKALWYPDFMMILRLKISRSEVEGMNDEKVNEIDEKIEFRVKNLKEASTYMMGLEEMSNTVFGQFESNPDKTFQTLMEEYKEHIKNQEVYDLYSYEKISDLKAQYYATDLHEMMRKLNLYYSESAIIGMADKLGYFTFLSRLAQPVNDLKWMK